MGKSLRSKVKRRFKTLKREVLNKTIIQDQLNEISAKLKLTAEGRYYRQEEAKNAFLYPNDPNAHFPQYQKQPLVDFRSSHIDFAGYEFIGGSRKKSKPAKETEDIAIELEEIPEQPEEQLEDDNEEDLMADFDKLKLGGKKKNKKNKMETEEDNNFLSIHSKKIGKTKKQDVKKSRKSMRF